MTWYHMQLNTLSIFSCQEGLAICHVVFFSAHQEWNPTPPAWIDLNSMHDVFVSISEMPPLYPSEQDTVDVTNPLVALLILSWRQPFVDNMLRMKYHIQITWLTVKVAFRLHKLVILDLLTSVPQ